MASLNRAHKIRCISLAQLQSQANKPATATTTTLLPEVSLEYQALHLEKVKESTQASHIVCC